MSDLEKALEYVDSVVWSHDEPLRPVFDAARRFASLTSPETKVWLCREGDERMQNWAYGSDGEPHCWFNGPREHNPECGEHFVVRAEEE